MRDVPIGLQRTELAHLIEVGDVAAAEYEPRESALGASSRRRRVVWDHCR
jgi:hypothetical protein